MATSCAEGWITLSSVAPPHQHGTLWNCQAASADPDDVLGDNCNDLLHLPPMMAGHPSGGRTHRLSPSRPAIMFTQAMLAHLFALPCAISPHIDCSNWAQGSLGFDATMNQPLVGS